MGKKRTRPDIRETFGFAVKARREELGLTQEELAWESNIAPSYLGGVERGQRNPSFKKLCSIAKVLRWDLGSLCRKLPLAHERF